MCVYVYITYVYISGGITGSCGVSYKLCKPKPAEDWVKGSRVIAPFKKC